MVDEKLGGMVKLARKRLAEAQAAFEATAGNRASTRQAHMGIGRGSRLCCAGRRMF